ncbi:MAG: hypothetical protein HYR60_11585 [Acidobacteria bacterium]|nr:hypothetical protein [Acidobacteriota bacterium]
MRELGIRVWVGALLLTAAALGQAPGGFVTVTVIKVKPEKRSDFEAIVKKMVDAHRKNAGDRWLTSTPVIGEGFTYYFSSLRQDYAEIEGGHLAFIGAMLKSYGQAGVTRMFQDFDACTINVRSELRRRRPDLSAPLDAAAMAKAIGESRWVRTNVTRLRQGRLTEYLAQVETLLKTLRANPPSQPPRTVNLVSQLVAGQQGQYVYQTSLAKSMADLGPLRPQQPGTGPPPSVQEFLKATRDMVLSNEVMINRWVPELSNPPDDVAAAAPDFWRPKAAVSAKPKPSGD